MPMKLVIRVPLRVSFCGGGTDLKDFYLNHGGAVVFSNITKYVYITLSPREDGQVILKDIDFGVETEFKFDDTPEFDGFLDLAKAAVRFLGIKKGVEILIKSDVAPGSGLGTSSAITVGLLKGLIELFGLSVPTYANHLAEMAYVVERDILNQAGGIQDHYAATCHGVNVLECSAQKTTVRTLNMRPSFISDLQMLFLLCYSGETHFA